jgi:hypothetical protein
MQNDNRLARALARAGAGASGAHWKGQCGARDGETTPGVSEREPTTRTSRPSWARPDSSRDFVVAQLKAHPGWTALDIGGGTGAWASLMAQHARVT